MAIFGNLADIPMPDILSAMGRKTGRFTVWNTSSQNYYELHLVEGSVTALLVNNEAIIEVFPLKNRMAELLGQETGEFEFENLAVRLLQAHHQFPVETMLLSGLAMLSEVAENRSQLPEPRTVFRLKNGKEPWLTGDLLIFWQRCQPLLKETASGERIAKSTDLYIDHVLLCLYKLRMAGIVVPLRAFEVAETHFPQMGAAPWMDTPLAAEDRSATSGMSSDSSEEGTPHRRQPSVIQKIMFRLRSVFSE